MLNKIKVYSTKTCTQCVPAKKYLRYKGIEFEEIDVTDDPMRLQRETGFSAVPVIIKEGYIPIVGYDVKALSQLI